MKQIKCTFDEKYDDYCFNIIRKNKITFNITHFKISKKAISSQNNTNIHIKNHLNHKC